MYDILTSILTSRFRVKPELIRPDAPVRALGLDSLFMVELSLVLRKDPGVHVEVGDLLGADTLAELARAIERKHHASA
ncbi:acyl carrier protein [Streptantibioticus cattleyicolor]|uniref:Carrier domain-containing protein n=1 Tax=Streptantibioticus cattleyicolor (strain ATCC 35852 / DSM 46488 / JCM 4925 / NBRC 14057 / NRRL 8057) TaxID=1003195 RepID=F8JMI7_STREN|nr:acyl carrier protein [Streptantibioticus cattleyicolor]AEW99331.1 hypothetical protein SCATT_p11380 [Streptantibioticus cattleyicolor NRRL 8057 = DSM 46488]CCB71629.1 conserved protein of unknown function [Streptantibioticus cattleyicolor NRRL 8057 = DSM 46488]